MKTAFKKSAWRKTPMPHSDRSDADLFGDAQPAAASSSLDLGALWRTLRRHRLLIVFAGLAGLGLGVALAVTTPKSYVATATLLIDGRKLSTLQNAYVFSAQDAGTVDMSSQIEVLKSAAIASRVVDNLQLDRKLLEQPQPKPPLWRAYLTSALERLGITGLTPPPAQKPLQRAEAHANAVAALKNTVGVTHVKGTAVLNISFSSEDGAQAARIANAFAEAYIDDQRSLQKEGSRRAIAWLNEQLDELKELVKGSEQAIQAFKAKKSIISTEGRLVEEQRLADTNRQLMQAQADIERLETQNAQLQEVIRNPATQSAASNFFSDPLVSQLRVQYLSVVSEEERLVDRLGERHQAVAGVRAQKGRFEGLLQGEYERIGNTVRGELQLAKARVKELESRFKQLTLTTTMSNESQIELRELERRNDAYKKMYSDLLERHQAAMQQQTFEDRNARVITMASIPAFADGPSHARMVIFALALGLAGGAGLGFLRDMSDRSFRTRRQAREELGIDRAWMLPMPSLRWRWLNPMARKEAAGSGLAAARPWLTEAVEKPASPFAETIEAIKIALDRQLPGHARLIGVVSCLAGEGRETVATNLAAVLAKTGAKTLLIDADLKSHTLTKLLSQQGKGGVGEAAKDPGTLTQHVIADERSGLGFLPASPVQAVAFTGDFLASAAFRDLLQRARDSFDYVVLDLAPISVHPDAEAVAPSLDGILLVVAWGKTSRSFVRDSLKENPVISDKCLGVALSVRKSGELGRYEALDSVRFKHRPQPA
jgi:succinoglycan biosynthesis transport protein ExoP